MNRADMRLQIGRPRTDRDLPLLLVGGGSLALVALILLTRPLHQVIDWIPDLHMNPLGAILIVRLSPARKALAQSALDNLKITTKGNEVEIRTQFAAASLASFVK